MIAERYSMSHGIIVNSSNTFNTENNSKPVIIIAVVDFESTERHSAVQQVVAVHKYINRSDIANVNSTCPVVQ